MIPYSRQWIDDEDIRQVTKALQSDFLTTGPIVEDFESDFSDFVGSKYAVAMSSGTSALHASMFAIRLGKNFEVIVPTMTFAATANCVVYEGSTPVFADIDPHTLLIDPLDVERKITPKTKAIIAVDYAGQPANYHDLRKIADKKGLVLIADSCHSLGSSYSGGRDKAIPDINTFSFHPVKQITTGEGGMATTENEEYAKRMRIFRNHGITNDYRQRADKGTWYYEMEELGYNYRISDFQCALGISQLKKLPAWISRRREIAQRYDDSFRDISFVQPLLTSRDVTHAYHLYVVKINFDQLNITRASVFKKLRAQGIGVNVHYIPVHLHPYYRDNFGTKPGLCPVAERVYEEILSLPIYPMMTDNEFDEVLEKFFSIIDNAAA